jgi:hypothetical protein
MTCEHKNTVTSRVLDFFGFVDPRWPREKYYSTWCRDCDQEIPTTREHIDGNKVIHGDTKYPAESETTQTQEG